jgi:hypothetical protein
MKVVTGAWCISFSKTVSPLSSCALVIVELIHILLVVDGVVFR